LGSVDEIRCQFVFSGKNDELTPNFRFSEFPVLFGSVLLCEQDVVIGIRVERWIEIDQIDRLVFDVPMKNVEVIPEVEMVHGTHIVQC